MLPILERPETLPPSAELLNMPFKTSSLPSLVGPSASQMLRSSFQTSRPLNIPQLNTTLMFHTEGHQQDSLTPITLVSKNFEESLNVSSARNMKLPLEVGHFTPASLTSHRSLNTELIGKELLLAPSEVQYVPNEVSSYQLLPVGKEHEVSASSNDSYLEAVGAFPVSTASSYHTSTIFSKLFHFHPISPKSIMGKKNPITLFSPSALFPVNPPASSTPSEEPLEALMNHQESSGLSTNMPSRVSSSHSFFAKSLMKYNPTTHQMVRKRASLSSTQGWPKPRVSTGEHNLSTRNIDAQHQVEAIHIVPVSSGTEARNLSVWLATTDFKPTSVPPDDTVRSVGLQGLFQNLPPRTVLAGASISRLQGTTVLPVGGGTSVMAASQSVWNRLMQPSGSETNVAGYSSASPRQGQHLEHKKGGNVGTEYEFLVRSSSQPAQTSLEGEHLGDKWIQDVVSSFSTPSPMFSTILNGPRLSTLSSSIEGRDGRGLLRQRSYWQNPQLHISESFPSLQTQVQPNPGSFEPPYNIRTNGDFLVDTASSTGATSELHSYTSGERVGLTRDPTGEGDGDDGEINEDNDDDEDDGSVSDLPPWDSSTDLFDWRAQHHRRQMRSDDVFLNGLAIVSDDVCSSGNYTTEMRLQPANRGKTLYPPGSFLAQIVLHDNGSRPTLSVKSCCVTATARPTGPEAASCCHFPRSVLGCKHVQIHQNSKSSIASFAIQLFRMLNHSVAYLHCELSVCLTGLAGCEENCLENKEGPSKPSDRRSYETLHNVISFGPVLRMEAESPLGPAPGSPLSVMFLAFLLSLTGTIGVVGTIVVLWVRWRGQAQKGPPLAPLAGSESP
nr:uncharacterized protein LOC132782681 [Anolis sagrei ordinatus]